MKIKNGLVFDPSSNLNKIVDIRIENGVIVEIGENLQEDAEIIDASGMWVSPGFIDMHTHLREPGYTHKEDIKSGTLSACHGGFTSILPMPNTKPATDCEEVVKFVLEKTKQEGYINVLPVGSITRGQDGEQITDFYELKKAGVVAFSEDGKSVLNDYLMEQAFIIAKENGLPILSHCEEEAFHALRDIKLWEKIGGHLHICHVSDKETINHLIKYKNERLTAEACPHHFILTSKDFDGKDTNFKMNPPLREKEDVMAVIKALKDNVVEVIATDHAPHALSEKNVSYEQAPNGIVGFETAFSLSYTYLVKTNVLTPMELIRKMTFNPAKILDLKCGRIVKGAPADITIINPNDSYVIDKNTFKSKSKNTPFDGMKVSSRVVKTIVGGKVVYDYR